MSHQTEPPGDQLSRAPLTIRRTQARIRRSQRLKPVADEAGMASIGRGSLVQILRNQSRPMTSVCRFTLYTLHFNSA